MNGIEIYDDTLTPEECEYIIDNFEGDTRKSIGVFGGNILDPTKKLSTDLCCNFSDVSFFNYNDVILKNLAKCTEQLQEKYDILKNIYYWGINNDYNIQKYRDGEGYFDLHCEHGENFSYRIAAWMIYLNDAESGTEFPYQNTVIQPKTGRCVMWGSSWFHAHKGVTPNVGEKYIATGWISYRI